MPKHASCAIANELLKRTDLALAPQMKLHFLVYLANGWNLAIHKEPLTEEFAEAWEAGPVFPVLWQKVCDYDALSKTHLLKTDTGAPFQAEFTQGEKVIIGRVLKKYAPLSVLELASIFSARQGTPWCNAFFGRGRNARLDVDEVAQHFVAMALAGREHSIGRAQPSEPSSAYAP